MLVSKELSTRSGQPRVRACSRRFSSRRRSASMSSRRAIRLADRAGLWPGETRASGAPTGRSGPGDGRRSGRSCRECQCLGEAAHLCRIDDRDPHPGCGEPVCDRLMIGRRGLDDQCVSATSAPETCGDPARGPFGAFRAVGERRPAQGLADLRGQDRAVQPGLRTSMPRNTKASLPFATPLGRSTLLVQAHPEGWPSIPSDLVKGAVERPGARSTSQTRGLTSRSG